MTRAGAYLKYYKLQDNFLGCMPGYNFAECCICFVTQLTLITEVYLPSKFIIGYLHTDKTDKAIDKELQTSHIYDQPKCLK